MSHSKLGTGLLQAGAACFGASVLGALVFQAGASLCLVGAAVFVLGFSVLVFR